MAHNRFVRYSTFLDLNFVRDQLIVVLYSVTGKETLGGLVTAMQLASYLRERWDAMVADNEVPF